MWVLQLGSFLNIGIPRTDFEYRHVAISALIFLEESRVTAKPAKPPIDIDEIRERLDTVRHSVMDHISGELAIEVREFLYQVTYQCHGRRRLRGAREDWRLDI